MAVKQIEATTGEGQVVSRAIYEVDPAHTVVEFAVKHMMFSTVKGRFASVAGQIEFDAADPTKSAVVATAEVASVDTREAQRDAHLRSPDFFDAERYPMITFASKRIEERSGEYRLVGDLTIHGVSREVGFDASYLGTGKDPWGGTRVGFSASTTINRKDFGLQWNVALEAGGWLVGDTIKINLEVEAVKKA